MDEKSCSICIDEYDNGDSVKFLPCSHFYHTSCIDQWLSKHTTCPLCKLDLMESANAQIT